MNNIIKTLWNAENYKNHSLIQKEAAMHLLEKISLNGFENILDVGSGDGKITAMIAKLVPDGFVTGLDISVNMIEFAQHSFPNNIYKNLTFLLQDAQEFDFNEKMHIIFSSFALQWMPNIDVFFHSAKKSLKPTGHMMATIPLGISIELEKAIEIVISSDKWANYFYNFSPEWYFQSPDMYKKLLSQNGFVLINLDTVEHIMIFESRKKFENYIIQWFSYLQPLPHHLRKLFFDEIVDTYLEFTSLLENEEIMFKFPRLDLIARKS
ncbi:MAG: methyltransferase domain-containing protein [Candidatus Rhabdochlamydia sp.]